MQSTNSHIDALLVHCYWFDDKSKNLLDIHGNLQLLAVACLLQEIEINKIVIPGGKTDPDKESIGLVMHKELSQKLNRKLASEVFVARNSITTRQEIKEFQKLVIKNQWQDIACLSLSAHLPRVRRIFKRMFGKESSRIRFFKTEGVLNQCGYKKEVVKYTNSPDFKLLKNYEILVGIIDRLPLVGGYLIDVMIKIFPWKGGFLSKINSMTKIEARKRG